ncbi:hypothetical protein EXIGLDRAFT_641442 [Exidia glandulosa HHB12029]|uniref:Extracellular metalloproteinase n=1 Tax=Exidia glandulosa HHB12029 TaxID=1314781 RepID=A0A165M018_EXIGL|nr:hypothetical protein EXIGLDRAFT_641442 [Exidia glandulosa HHB12029]
MLSLLSLFPVVAAGSATFSSFRLAGAQEFQTFHPASTFEVFPNGIDHPLSGRAQPAHFRDSALAFIHKRLGNGTTLYKSGFESDVAAHVYVHQQFNGIPVTNAIANVAQNKAGKVTSFASSFVSARPRKVPSSVAKLSAEQAGQRATSALGGSALNDREWTLAYLALNADELVLTYAIPLQLSPEQRVLAYVDAATSAVVSVINQTLDLTYRAIPITARDPNDGFELIVDPEDLVASPSGWTTPRSGINSHATRGNNVVATLYTGTLTAPEPFDNYTWDASLEPDDQRNVNASIVNAFYVLNTVHDVFYRYGFTEDAFNFQGADAIFLRVQSTITRNNAFFFPTPDGTPPEIHMLLWDSTSPMRDGDLETDIIAHEATHGLTTRLIGGGSGGCVNSAEAGALGEGWSDAFADWLAQTSEDIKDFALGTYVLDSPIGIRSAPYSTDTKVNNITFELLQSSEGEVHVFGELWAEVLHLQLAALVAEYGFTSDARTNPTGTGGNVIWLHLFVDSLPLLPCQPTFLDARTSWIQADAVRYEGRNKCLLWKVFAGRGIGVGAKADHVNNFEVPEECA